MQAIQPSTRISLSRILLATDFSPASERALAYATALARQYEAQVYLGHVLSPEPHLSIPLDPLPRDADSAWLDAEEKLAEWARSASMGNISERIALETRVLLEKGEFWKVISAMVGENHIDLIVAGTRGRTGISKLAFGSNAEMIYRRASCPVLTVGPKVSPLKGEAWRIKQILFPTDGSKSSLSALPYALSLAEENQATLILAKMTFPGSAEFAQASGTEALAALVPAAAEAWCKPEFVIRNEFPADGILRLAVERDVDVIVMGVKASAASGSKGRLPWPVASQVVAGAACPVLTVRA